jgi:hypothetical protein
MARTTACFENIRVLTKPNAFVWDIRFNIFLTPRLPILINGRPRSEPRLYREK